MEENTRYPKRPNLPTEQVIHYIVKDYRRMFMEFDAMRERAEKAEAKLADAREKNRVIRDSLLKQQNDHKKELLRLQESRDRYVDMMTEDLRAELTESNRKVQKLAEALIDPNVKADVMARLMQPRSIGKNESDWLEKSLVQLTKANRKLLPAEERMRECHAMLMTAVENGCNTGIVQSAVGKLPKFFSKIDSALQCIDNFFKITGNIEIDTNEV